MTTDTLADTDRIAISAGMDHWLAAFNAADVGGLVADAAADVIVFPPNQPAVTGVAALRHWHDAQMKQVVTTITNVKTEEITGGGTFALQRFSFGIKVQPRSGGATIEDSGMCFWIWRREPSGRWVIARSLWNSSNPLPA